MCHENAAFGKFIYFFGHLFPFRGLRYHFVGNSGEGNDKGRYIGLRVDECAELLYNPLAVMNKYRNLRYPVFLGVAPCAFYVYYGVQWWELLDTKIGKV